MYPEFYKKGLNAEDKDNALDLINQTDVQKRQHIEGKESGDEDQEDLDE